MLAAILAGRGLHDVRNAELWRGELPPGMLGQRILDDVTEQVKAITRTAWRVIGDGGPGRPADLRAVDIDIDLPELPVLSEVSAGPSGLDRTVTDAGSTDGDGDPWASTCRDASGGRCRVSPPDPRRGPRAARSPGPSRSPTPRSGPRTGCARGSSRSR